MVRALPRCVPLIALAWLAMAPGSAAQESLVAPRNFSTPSDSMAPTLTRGDVFMAEMAAYSDADPQRGAIVVMRTGDGTRYVWRIVGLPGETLQVIDGVVHIGGKAARLTEDPGDPSPGFPDARRLAETLPGGSSHLIQSLAPHAAGDNTGVFAVPEGHYFMMGDNRDNANDSRFAQGMVPRSEITGKAKRIIWAGSFSRIGQSLE